MSINSEKLLSAMTPGVTSKIMGSFSASESLSLPNLLGLAVTAELEQHQDTMVYDKLNLLAC